MKFRKLLSIIAVLTFMFAIPAFACEGPDCDAEGSLGIGVAAGNIGYDAAGKLINNGAAGSIGVGAGGAAGLAAGYVNNGTVSAVTSVVGGGAAGAESYKVNLGKGIKDLQGVKVGSQAGAVAQTGGSMDVSVDPKGKMVIDGFGIVGGAAGGVAAQGTLSGSIIGAGKNFESKGLSVGVAGQGSTGSWSGSAHAESLGDLTYDKTTVTYEGGEDGGPGWYQKQYCRRGKCHAYGRIQYFSNGHPGGPSEWVFKGLEKVENTETITLMDSKADAGFEANIHMYGNSYSESYRYIDTRVEGARTEGYGTNVGAETHVTSSGSAYSNRDGLANSGAHVSGGYNVAGGAASLTVQESMGQGSMGGAVAGAIGTYSGSGDLGCNFDGSATGFTSTSVTTFDGMNGSINSASAGMEVSAHTNSGGNDPR